MHRDTDVNKEEAESLGQVATQGQHKEPKCISKCERCGKQIASSIPCAEFSVEGREHADGPSINLDDTESAIVETSASFEFSTSTHITDYYCSKTHSAPNCRMPSVAAVQDDDYYQSFRLSKPGQTKEICKFAQPAQREATGYFCTYVFKRQACERFAMRATAETSNYVELGLQNKSADRQKYRTCNRLIMDWNHRCIARTVSEEFNLAANRRD